AHPSSSLGLLWPTAAERGLHGLVLLAEQRCDLADGKSRVRKERLGLAGVLVVGDASLALVRQKSQHGAHHAIQADPCLFCPVRGHIASCRAVLLSVANACSLLPAQPDLFRTLLY